MRQILIAAGSPLSIRQDDVTVRGAALECRINAEDPARGFLPCPGRVERLTLPGGPFVRVDGYLDQGLDVPAQYDSLLAKVVVWAPDRRQAIARMDRALGECSVSGVPSRARRSASIARRSARPGKASAARSTGGAPSTAGVLPSEGASRMSTPPYLVAASPRWGGTCSGSPWCRASGLTRASP